MQTKRIGWSIIKLVALAEGVAAAQIHPRQPRVLRSKEMLKKTWLIPAIAGSLLLAVSPGFATDPPVQKQAQEQVYGSQLMTAQERTEYQAKMRAAKSAEDREKIRAQHHKAMQVRAKEKGLTLPDEPPSGGMGGGMGSGGGMGPGGGGMGPGGGRKY
jgi:hypothetical protein